MGTTLIGAAAGAIMGMIVNLCMNRWRLWKLHHKLEFEALSRTGTRGTARIYNNYIYGLRGAFAYITIDHNLEDILPPPPPFDAFITPEHRIHVYEDRLCWSTTMPVPNPPVVDICPGEKQSLDIVNVDTDGKWIEIPSENGWATSQNHGDIQKGPKNDEIRKSRVFLRPRKYNVTIKIVNRDTKAKEFRIEIDPMSTDRLISLESAVGLQSRLAKIF